ncbi:hypothetical protein Lser_V15G36956 [Lactuca serriola]
MASNKATSDVADGPVLAHINKRIRNLRKKLKRIAHLEDSIAQGKSIIKNKDQEKLLKSKPMIIAAVDELEKSRQPLSVAVDEEITLALQRHHNDNVENCNKSQTLDGDEEQHAALPVDDLLSLIYFGSMFDAKQVDVDSRSEERGWCLLHDYILRSELCCGLELEERHLEAIARLSSLMISRPVDSSHTSHQDALQRCIEHANNWICKSEKKIDPNSEFTYADVREMVTKIMGLGYFKNTPFGPHKYQLVPDHLMYSGHREKKENTIGYYNSDFEDDGYSSWDCLSGLGSD